MEQLDKEVIDELSELAKRMCNLTAFLLFMYTFERYICWLL